MTILDTLMPRPRLVEIARADLAAPADVVWARVRHGDLPQSGPIRALFALRALAGGWQPSARPAPAIRLDAMTSSPERPGFQVLAETPGTEVAVGAIGQVWKPAIPFVHVADAAGFAAFAVPAFVKVAWAIRVSPRGTGSHVEVEVRVDATDARAWRRFRAYFTVIGPASRYIRRTLLRALVLEFGPALERADGRTLAGDDRLADADAQMTHTVDIAAPPEAIWPWLAQMGCGRAGFYSIDALDNGGVRSAREIHPDLQRLVPGAVLPATPRGPDGFEVLRADPPRVLVLGVLQDAASRRALPFDAARPPRFWQVTWAFVLEPLDGRSTRLHARVRGAFPLTERARAAWMRPIHHVMQRAQLRNIARRAEGRMPRDDWRDVAGGWAGAARIAANVVTPFLRGRRARWGLSAALAQRALPGDDLVARPRWGWTHGIEIDAPAAEVWPWVAQIGADRRGFYSHQWLENLAGCGVRNAETVHPEWELRLGDALSLHPDAPPLRIVGLERGRYVVAHAGADPEAVARQAPWVAASWLFLLEPLGERRCRLISRHRVAMSDDAATRVSFGPALLEPIGAEMDRRMLLGVKARVTAVAG
jgi:hypothetical protein